MCLFCLKAVVFTEQWGILFLCLGKRPIFVIALPPMPHAHERGLGMAWHGIHISEVTLLPLTPVELKSGLGPWVRMLYPRVYKYWD